MPRSTDNAWRQLCLFCFNWKQTNGLWGLQYNLALPMESELKENLCDTLKNILKYRLIHFT